MMCGHQIVALPAFVFWLLNSNPVYALFIACVCVCARGLPSCELLRPHTLNLLPRLAPGFPPTRSASKTLRHGLAPMLAAYENTHAHARSKPNADA